MVSVGGRREELKRVRTLASPHEGLVNSRENAERKRRRKEEGTTRRVLFPSSAHGKSGDRKHRVHQEKGPS